MRKSAIATLKKMLEDQKKRLLENINSMSNYQQDVNRADRSSDEIDMEYAHALSSEVIEQYNAKLQEIESALNKINHGKFGVCNECNKIIADKRLKAMPSARLCYKCASEAES